MVERPGRLVILILLVIVLAAVGVQTFTKNQNSGTGDQSRYKGGKVVSVEAVKTVPEAEVLNISRQNYAAAAPTPKNGVIQALIKYTSTDLENNQLVEYARAYVPATGSKLPIFAFAPGTTGMGDQCAASLEQPAVKNWQNYESHMMTYAGQGFASVITDYEGMRDPSRLHHYMVGKLEGRAVLDSIRALQNWKQVNDRLDPTKVIIAGFSQGGHSAMWADKIAATYAPDINVAGVVGFAPVSDVTRTIADVTRGANINWFGPFVLASYNDFYGRNYGVERILLPKYSAALNTDVINHCIDSVLAYWGNKPQAVYSPEFLQAISTGTLKTAGYGLFEDDMKLNIVGDQNTKTPKLLVQGDKDNVILPAQTKDAFIRMCGRSRGSVSSINYPEATHYNVLVLGFNDTLNWVKQARSGSPARSSCP